MVPQDFPLPQDILDAIFSHLALPDAQRAAATCRQFSASSKHRRRALYALALKVGEQGTKAAPAINNISESTCREGQWWFDIFPHYYCMFPTLAPTTTFAICTFDVVLPWYVAEVQQPTGPLKVWWERLSWPTSHPDAASIIIGLLIKASGRRPQLAILRKGHPDAHCTLEAFFGVEDH